MQRSYTIIAKIIARFIENRKVKYIKPSCYPRLNVNTWPFKKQKTKCKGENLPQNESIAELKLPLSNCNTGFIFDAAMEKYVTSVVLKSRVPILPLGRQGGFHSEHNAWSPGKPPGHYGEPSLSLVTVFHLLHGLTCHSPALFHIRIHDSTHFHNTGWDSFKFSSTVMLLLQS